VGQKEEETGKEETCRRGKRRSHSMTLGREGICGLRRRDNKGSRQGNSKGGQGIKYR
jgi:hypothetical protein